MQPLPVCQRELDKVQAGTKKGGMGDGHREWAVQGPASLRAPSRVGGDPQPLSEPLWGDSGPTSPPVLSAPS